MMVEVVGASDGIVEAMQAAQEAGIDQAHLMYLLTLVADGKITDFYTEDIVEHEDGELEIVITNVPQFKSEVKHCRLVQAE